MALQWGPFKPQHPLWRKNGQHDENLIWDLGELGWYCVNCSQMWPCDYYVERYR